MSDEQFDKNIKQKLESVRPDFEEAAWKKFRAAVPVPWYATLFQDWGGWIFGGLASAAFLTTLYFNYLQQKTNELLNEEISTIKSIQIPQNKVDTVIIEKYLTDTIYVVKTIRQVVEVPVKNDLQNSEFITGSNKPADYFRTKDIIQGSNTGGDIVGINSGQSIAEKKSSERTSNPTTRNAAEIADNKKVAEKKEPISESKEIEKATDENGNVIREKPELAKEEVERTDNAPVSDLVIPETKTEKSEKKKFQFPYVRTRVGLIGDYLGVKIPAVGPTAEFFFGYSNLSMSTGVLFSSPQETKHSLTKDFNQATGKRFEDFYKDKISNRGQRNIEDITIRTSFIKVPIAFNYYINTRSNFDFMFTAGTRLDVSVFQDIQFESNSLTDRIREQFEARPQAKVFSGLFYGMGLQYQKGRFVGQLTPYFDFRFRQNEYVTIPRTFGVNASVKYDLGRGL